MYVRALYNYAADDPTSLSFHQGDIIQVLTQLESGWWDGIVNGQRGWFPSNYCALVPNGDLTNEDIVNGHVDGPEDEVEGPDYDDYDDTDTDDSDGDGRGRGSPLPLEGTDNSDNDEAAFWLPQVTPDGRLYYFNTMTGHSRMELPLETPTSNMESGPRDRLNFSAPEQTRPPPELMAAGFVGAENVSGLENEDDTRSSVGDGEMLMLAMHSPIRV